MGIKLRTFISQTSTCYTDTLYLMNNRTNDLHVVQYFNYLSFVVDAEMFWKRHVAKVRNKLSCIHGLLHRLN